MNKVTLQNDQISSRLPLRDGRTLDLSSPVVMGVLNVTPDSFSDGGKFHDPSLAVERALRMQEEGASLIDIGGESTRPGAHPVGAEEEIHRIAPVIREIRKRTSLPISVDTYRAETALRALDEGADIINDISALRLDPRMGELIANTDVPVILMHMLGTPATMQQAVHYDDCVGEIDQFFQEQIAFARVYGIEKSRMLLDPGIGFGKRIEDNLELLGKLDRFKHHGMPIVVGVSRKSFIGKLDYDADVENRLGGSLAAAIYAVMKGAMIIRTHDVRETVQAIRVLIAIQTGNEAAGA